MLLRHLSDASSSLKVVGPYYVAGVMFGETIHGPFPGRYRPVTHINPDVDMIDRSTYGVWDYAKMILKTDPAEILREIGIEPTSYWRYPHKLDVSRDTLTAAGVKVEDVHLI